MTPRKKLSEPGQQAVATNRRARHDFDISERIECGIVLTGPEVKSLRAGRASLQDAFARVRGSEVWLEGMHIPPYEFADTRGYEAKRPRKLLLHRRQIDGLLEAQQEKGLSLVPLRAYFVHGMAKVELGVGRGRRAYEKRHAIAAREHQREIEREMGRRR
jgi:SsrA-binding protein